MEQVKPTLGKHHYLNYALAYAIGPDSPWHAYRREERQAPWKALLPITAENPVLAMGLKGNALASLARSWGEVAVHNCTARDLDWAREQGESLGQKYHFDQVELSEMNEPRYAAIVIGAESSDFTDSRLIYRLLAAGGTAAWISTQGGRPILSDLRKFGYQKIRTYALIPPGSGKLMLPLEDSRFLRAALQLYTPGKWHNRLALHISRLPYLLKFFIGDKHVVIARKPGDLGEGTYLLDWLGQRLELPVVEVTVYTGWAKLVLQLLDKEGKILGIAKMTDISLGCIGLQRESATLGLLENVPEFQGSIPRILLTREWGDHAVQLQTAVVAEVKNFSARLKEPHRQFLACLSKLDCSEGSLEKWPQWPVLWSWAKEGKFDSSRQAEVARAAVESCYSRLGIRKIPFHRVHGDFTPFHALLAGNTLIVVDWEESEAVGLPLYDAIHFILARDLHLRNINPAIDHLLTQHKFAVFRELKEQGLTGSSPIREDIFELALVSACMALTSPQLRYATWGQ